MKDKEVDAMKRNIYIENMPVEQACDLFIRELEILGFFHIRPETIEVTGALGRVNSEPVFSRLSSPHFNASAMDGIAVQAASTFMASETRPVLLNPGEYLEVDTGDHIPREWDAVIMIEDVNVLPDKKVQLIKAAVPWQHIRSVGEDLIASDLLLPSFTSIGPYELAALLTAGIARIPVVKIPRVSIIPTGSELVPAGTETLSPGEIMESNSYMIEAMAREWGIHVHRTPIVPDDFDLIKQAVETVKDHSDLIVICSGSSAGSEDYTSHVINRLGRVLVHGLAVRPGKPAILGIIDAKPVLGLPGYPISAQLIFHMFARPLLYKKQQRPLPDAVELEGHMTRRLASHMGADEYFYVNIARMEDRYRVYPLERGAGITSTLVKADGYTVLERGKEGVNAGETCRVTTWRSRKIIDHTLVCMGSHDMSIDILRDMLQRDHGRRLISSNSGSMGGIMSLVRRETHMSGLHLLDEKSGDYNLPFLQKYLPREQWLLINLARRQQGLMVQKGNPLGINGLPDLTRPGIRFINRQKGSGTRILLDYLLGQAGIDPSVINGYTREEYSHLAVAASLAGDGADAALGIYAGARIMDLDFIPLTEERYDLCLLSELLSQYDRESLFQLIRSGEFKTTMEQLGGYNLVDTGKIIHVHEPV